MKLSLTLLYFWLSVCIFATIAASLLYKVVPPTPRSDCCYGVGCNMVYCCWVDCGGCCGGCGVTDGVGVEVVVEVEVEVVVGRGMTGVGICVLGGIVAVG